MPLHKLSKSNLVLGLKIASIIVATLAVFHQDLAMVANDALQTQFMSYILAIPFLFAYLIYRKRKMLRAVIPLENQSQTKEARYLLSTVEILLVIIAIVLYWHFSYTFQPLEYHMLALPIFVAGLLLIFFNPQTLRQLAFAIAFLIFLVPPPSEILYGVGANLSVVSSEASNAIVNAFGIPSSITTKYGNPSIIITRPDGTTLPFTVDIACSGIYSLIGFLVFVVLVAYIIRDKLWKRLSLLALGIPLIYLLNIVRITIILLIGYNFGEELALQIFHLLGGWILIFLGTPILLLISEKIFKTHIFANPTEKCSQCNTKPQSTQSFCFACGRILKPADITFHKRDIIKLLAITSAIILLMSIQMPAFVLTQGPPIVTKSTPLGQQVSTGILPQISDYNLSFVYRDTSFEKIAKEDMALIYLYTPISQSHEPIWVAIEIASNSSSLYEWEIYLIRWPTLIGIQSKATQIELSQVTQIELKDVQLTQNPPIISRYVVFQYKDTNETQAVLYWYEYATFNVNSTSQQKHVKISLTAYPEILEDLPNIENQLAALAKEIANYWEPIKTWSQIALLISQNSINLMGITSALLVAIVVLNAFKTKRQRKANANVYQKLSKSDRQIIDGVRETEKQAIPTLNNITTTYQKTIAQSIDRDHILQRLSEMEKAGIIKSSVANKQDEPTQTWKAEGKADEKPMKMRISLRRPEILTVLLLLIGITLVALSIFFFTRLDLVVHGDLYRYGLQFNYEWAVQYWTYSRLILTSLVTAIVVAGFSIAFILANIRTYKINLKIVSCPLLIVGIGAIIFSAFFLNNLDYIVHSDLYRYGLQFSYEWAGKYWTYLRLIQGLLGLVVVTNTISITLILAAERIHKIWTTMKKAMQKYD